MKGGRIDAYFKRVPAPQGDGQAKSSPHVLKAAPKQSPTPSHNKENTISSIAEECGLKPKGLDAENKALEQSQGCAEAKLAPTPLGPPEVVVLDESQATPATASVRKRLLCKPDAHEQQQDTAHKRQKPEGQGAGQPTPVQICLSSDNDSPPQQPAEKRDSSQVLAGSAQPASRAMSGQMGESQQSQQPSQASTHAAEARSSSQLGTPDGHRPHQQPDPATGPQQPGDSQQGSHTWTLDELAVMIEDTKAALSQELLLPVTPSATTPLQVAAFIEGRKCVLSELLTLLADHLARVSGTDTAMPPAATTTTTTTAAAAAQAPDSTGSAGGDAGQAAGGSASLGSASDSASLREQVLDLACRRPYGAKQGLPEGVAAAGDTDPDAFWFWELRDPRKALAAGGAGAKASAAITAVATSNKKLTDLYRKRRKELHERLSAGLSLQELLVKMQEAQQADAGEGGKPGRKAAVPGGKALQQKIIKVAAKLDKLPSLHQVESVLEAGISALGEKDAARLAQLTAKQDERKVAKAEADARRASEKEARAAEREARAAEKARETADKEAAKAAKEASKEAKAAGFSNAKALEKSKAMMASFLKLPSKTPNTAAAKLAGGLTHTPSPAAFNLNRLPPDTAERLAGQGEAAAGAGPSQHAPQPFSARLAQLVDTARAELDPLLPGPDKPPVAELQALLSELRGRWRREARTRRRPCKGAPPTWARRPGPQPSLHERCVALWGDAYQVDAVRLIRKKLLAFADNTRPPYYGSWSRSSVSVLPRRPLARDITLDYEVDSDQEWEEEPEGTDLGACSDDDVSECRVGGEGGEEEEEEEGFVVDDGYLSGDEGVRLDEDVMEVDGGEGGPGKTAAGVDVRLAALEAGVTRALRSNRPLVLCGLPGVTCDPPASLDARLLHVLCGTVLRPVMIGPPRELDVYTPAARDDKCQQGPQSGGAAQFVGVPGTELYSGGGEDGSGLVAAGGAVPAGGGGGRGRQAQPFPPALIPRLHLYIQRTTERGVDKVVEGFLASLAASAAELDPVTGAAAPPLPHVSKKATKECIKQMASYVAGRGWVVKTGAAPAAVTPSTKSAAVGAARMGGSSTPGPCLPQPELLQATPSTAGASATAGQQVQASNATKLLPTPVARAAATQLLAVGANLGHQAAPAGAPTPWPTPATTFPAPGGEAGARLVATGAVLPPTGAPSTQPWRFAPVHTHPAAAGTPVSPIPCPLALAQAPSMLLPTPTHVSAVPTGLPLPGPPANTPCTLQPKSTPVNKPGEAPSVSSHRPGGLPHNPTQPGPAASGAPAALDPARLSARMQQLAAEAPAAAGLMAAASEQCVPDVHMEEATGDL